MAIAAYIYLDPLLHDQPPEPDAWGTPVDRVYQDLQQNLSSESQQEPTLEATRPALTQFLTDAGSVAPNPPAFECLLVQRLEDLGDSLTEVAAVLDQLANLGVQLQVADQAVSLDSTVQARSNLLKLLQTCQTQQRSRRLRQGHARNRLQALPPPGRAPYGYRRGKEAYVIDRTTAPVVKEFFEHFILYGSLRGAVRQIAKRYNKKISASTGLRWLTNPAYRGDLGYKNGDIISDTHSPLITREEAAQIDRLLKRNRRLAPRTASSSRSLAGLVRCGTCQSPMTIARVTQRDKAKEYLYLRPVNCPQVQACKSRDYNQVLQQIIEQICVELPATVRALTLPDTNAGKAKLAAAIARQQELLTQVADLETQGILDAETAQLRRYKLQTELSVLRQRLAQLPPINLQEVVQAVAIPQFWLDLSESERRFFFREFIKVIELKPDQEEQIQIQFVF